MEDFQDFKIRTNEKKSERIFYTVFLKHKYITETTVTPSNAVVKLLKYPEKEFLGYLEKLISKWKLWSS